MPYVTVRLRGRRMLDRRGRYGRDSHVRWVCREQSETLHHLHAGQARLGQDALPGVRGGQGPPFRSQRCGKEDDKGGPGRDLRRPSISERADQGLAPMRPRSRSTSGARPSGRRGAGPAWPTRDAAAPTGPGEDKKSWICSAHGSWAHCGGAEEVASRAGSRRVLMVPFASRPATSAVAPQDATASIVAAAASDESSEKPAEKPARTRGATGPRPGPVVARARQGVAAGVEELSLRIGADLMKRLGASTLLEMKAFESASGPVASSARSRFLRARRARDARPSSRGGWTLVGAELPATISTEQRPSGSRSRLVMAGASWGPRI